MKVTVKTFLNVRVGKPSVNAPCYQYLAPGSELEVDGKLYHGDRFEGVDTWLKDEAENYYWSGGVNFEKTAISSVMDPTEAYYWVQRFGIDETFEELKEQVKRVRITLLDTGIDDQHEDLKGQILRKENVVWKGKTASDNDGHGTHCAGILVGSGAKRVYGVLPGCNLSIGKIMTSASSSVNGFTAAVLVRAIDLFGPTSDVISLSAGIPEDDPILHNKIKEYSKKGVVFVAAIGNVESGNIPNYPALYKECISVGALDANLELSTHTVKDSSIDICFPGENIVSTLPTSMGCFGPKSGTSMATPFIAGIVALLKAKTPSMQVEDIRLELDRFSEIKQQNSFSYKAIKNEKITL